jgi:sugar lactone lactonase YvrE
MRRLFLLVPVIGFFLSPLTLPLHADQSGVVRFATLPKPGPGFPEGIAADEAGNIYVATFDSTTTNVIHIFGHNGRLRDTIPLPGALPLGLAFDQAGNLYVADFGNGDVLKFEPPFTASSTPADMFDVCAGPLTPPSVPPVPVCGLNAITFDANGDLYVSDSFGGNIFKIDLPNGPPSTFFTHDALKPATHADPAFNAFPGFGANGLAFNASGTALFIANTGDDRILKLNLVDGSPTTLETFAESINGADGILFDTQGRLWVAANQADEVVALNATTGRIVERRGSFEDIGRDGAARGLLFPASIVLSRGSIFVTNAALALTPALGDDPEEDVATFTVSRIPIGKTGQ